MHGNGAKHSPPAQPPQAARSFPHAQLTFSDKKHKTQQTETLSQAANKPSFIQNCLLHHCSKSQMQLHLEQHSRFFLSTALPSWREGGQHHAHKLQSGNLQFSNNIIFVPTQLKAHVFPYVYDSLKPLSWSLSKTRFFSTVSFQNHRTPKQPLDLLPFLGWTQIAMEGENGGTTSVLEEGISKGLQHSSLPPVQDHIFYYSSDLQDSVVLHPAMSPEIIRQFLNCEKSWPHTLWQRLLCRTEKSRCLDIRRQTLWNKTGLARTGQKHSERN